MSSGDGIDVVCKLFDIPLKEAKKCIATVHKHYPEISEKEIIAIVIAGASPPTTTQCLKVASLRKESGDPTITLEKWMNDPNNVYVGRRGRIFIDKKIFHYKGSKFGNPYPVPEYTLEDSLRLYEEYLHSSGLINEIEELRGKNLGCFCDQRGDCHAKVLVKYLS